MHSRRTRVAQLCDTCCTTIEHFFNNGATNASAECFTAKLKKFEAELRGVNDVPFSLYRVTNIYAK
ncbi:MAG: hypothetical protein ACRCY5_01085 [Phocaeicola sp.]